MTTYDLQDLLDDAPGSPWHPPDDPDALRAAHLELWEQIPFDPGFHAACAERLQTATPIAVGPARTRTINYFETTAVVWRLAPEDPHAPDDRDRLFLSFGGAFPALLWPSCPPTRDGVARLLAYYLADGSPSLHTYPRVEKLLMQIQLDSLEPIQNTTLNLEPWIDDAMWANGHIDDPFRTTDRPMPMLRLMHLREDAAATHSGRFVAFGCRSLFSRAALRVAAHGAGLFVFEARYHPAPDDGAALAAAATVNLDLPPDLPADLAALFLRGHAISPSDLPALEAEHGASALIGIRCALGPADPATHATLRALIVESEGDDDALGWFDSLANVYDMPGLRYLAASLAGPDLAAAIDGDLALEVS